MGWKRGKVSISYPELYKNSSSVIFTDFIRSDLLIFTKKKKKKFPIPEFRSSNELQAKLISHFDSKLDPDKMETSLKTNKSNDRTNT